MFLSIVILEVTFHKIVLLSPVGGGYGTDFNRRKLRRIAHDMGFEHVNISGMGSTWFV